MSLVRKGSQARNKGLTVQCKYFSACIKNSKYLSVYREIPLIRQLENLGLTKLYTFLCRYVCTFPFLGLAMLATKIPYR